MARDKILNLALETDLIAFPSETLNHGVSCVENASAFFYLATAFCNNPEDKNVKSKILEHLNELTSGGKEPSFNIGHTWSYPMIVNGIALLKKSPLWSELEAETIERINCLMKGFAYLLHYACDKDNNYETGLRRDQHWGKHWSPNCYANLLLYAMCLCDYFGGKDAFAELFISFNYDNYIADLKKFNFTHALKTFSTPAIETEYFRIPSAKEILEGTATTQYHVEELDNITNYSYGGEGKGIKREFLYSIRKPTPASGWDIVRGVASRMYKLPCVSAIEFSNGVAKIADDTVSPEEGKIGMFYELNQAWRSGRSSINHARIDFAIMISSMYAMKELKLMDIMNEPMLNTLYERIRIGNDDLIYKLEHGYKPYIDGPRMVEYETNFAGYYFWKDIWQNDLQK